LHAKKSNAKGRGKGSRHETTTKMHNMEPIHNDPLNKACPKTKQKGNPSKHTSPIGNGREQDAQFNGNI
jgi:hypothetical protein